MFLWYCDRDTQVHAHAYYYYYYLHVAQHRNNERAQISENE